MEHRNHDLHKVRAAIQAKLDREREYVARALAGTAK